MKLLIDFDGVIHDNCHPSEGHKMGPPIKDAVEAIQGLKKRGIEIIIYTARISKTAEGSGESKKHIADWLDYFKIPYDKITNIKEPSDFYIDDNAIHFDSWRQAVRDMRIYN